MVYVRIFILCYYYIHPFDSLTNLQLNLQNVIYLLTTNTEEKKKKKEVYLTLLSSI